VFVISLKKVKHLLLAQQMFHKKDNQQTCFGNKLPVMAGKVDEGKYAAEEPQAAEPRTSNVGQLARQGAEPCRPCGKSLEHPVGDRNCLGLLSRPEEDNKVVCPSMRRNLSL